MKDETFHLIILSAGAGAVIGAILAEVIGVVLGAIVGGIFGFLCKVEGVRNEGKKKKKIQKKP